MNADAMNATWYGDQPPGALLRGLERVYRRGLASRRRKGIEQRCTALEAHPIVVVGNLTVGGAGKSPLVMHLCQIALEAGLKPGVVSRGYGRSSKTPLDVTPHSPPAQAGDEPLMIARRCQVPVRVDADREAAALHLLETAGVDLVIADDGLQRWRLPRDLEICVVDGQRGFGNGHLLPAGPLREPIERIETVDEVVINGTTGPDLGRDTVSMTLQAGEFVHLKTGETLQPDAMASHSMNQPVRAAAGIGRPERFFETLESLGVRAAHQQGFADHHDYRMADFDPPQARWVMTEKDAVKCGGLDLDDAWFLRVDALLPDAWNTRIRAKMQALVEEKSA